MYPLQPSPDWYEAYWHSREPAEASSWICPILASLVASALAVRRGWSGSPAVSPHRHLPYRGALESFPTPFLYAEALGRLG
jgi:hypothetical protein